LIRGGTSSVGLALVLIAKQQGITVLSTTRSVNKITQLQRVGVEHVILDDGYVAEKVRKLYPLGVNCAIELVGAPTLRDTLAAVAVHGTVCFTGMLSNKWIIKDFYPIDYLPRGVRLSAYYGDSSDLPKHVLQKFIDDVTAGKIELPIAHKYTMNEIIQAHRDLESGKYSGKLVVTVRGDQECD